MNRWAQKTKCIVDGAAWIEQKEGARTVLLAEKRIMLYFSLVLSLVTAAVQIAAGPTSRCSCRKGACLKGALLYHVLPRSHTGWLGRRLDIARKDQPSRRSSWHGSFRVGEKAWSLNAGQRCKQSVDFFQYFFAFGRTLHSGFGTRKVAPFKSGVPLIFIGFSRRKKRRVLHPIRVDFRAGMFAALTPTFSREQCPVMIYYLLKASALVSLDRNFLFNIASGSRNQSLLTLPRIPKQVVTFAALSIFAAPSPAAFASKRDVFALHGVMCRLHLPSELVTRKGGAKFAVTV